MPEDKKIVVLNLRRGDFEAEYGTPFKQALEDRIKSPNLVLEFYEDERLAIKRVRHSPYVDLFVTDEILQTIRDARTNGFRGMDEQGQPFKGEALFITSFPNFRQLEGIVKSEKLAYGVVFLPDYTPDQIAEVIIQLAETGHSITYEILSGRMPELQ